MTATRQELIEVLREARRLLSLPGNDFAWSSWEDADAATSEVDELIAMIEADVLPRQLAVAVLFAPTGPIQEVSLSSGWAYEFIDLASRFDAVEAVLYQ